MMYEDTGDCAGYVLVLRDQERTRSPQPRADPRTQGFLRSNETEGDNEESTVNDQGLVEEIGNFVQTLEPALWILNDLIHRTPELAFREHKAHDAITTFLESRMGWNVTKSAYGMQTAWAAAYDSGKPGPTVSFNAEMDALPGIGHACGHNLIAAASLAAGLATAEAMERHQLPGKAMIFGTPGEEFIGKPGGKIRLLEAGAFDGVDVSMISHPGILNNSPLVRTTAFMRLEAEYFGRAAHGANSPWLGVNALDAIVIAYNAVSVLRQQTMSRDVIGMSITNGGNTPNIIHTYAAGVCVLRAATTTRLAQLQQKVEACFRAGAEATGARLKLKVVPGYADHEPNRVLARSYRKYWDLIPGAPDPPIPPEGQFTWVKASTDQGNLSYALPSMNVSFAIPKGPEAGQPHSPDFEKAAGTRGAFERALRVGKTMAATAVDVLSNPDILAEVKEQWRRDMEVAKQGSPGDARGC